MLLKQRNGLKWHEFELLAGYPLVHACFTVHGGISTGSFASLNFSRTVGDSPENVQENVQRVKETLNLPYLMIPKMEHKANIVLMNHPLSETPIGDALSTRTANLGLMMTQADCQAAIFYDPVRHAMVNAHCGWRGNVHNIYRAAIHHMQQTYHSNPKDILVCISPSLGPEHSEFIHFKNELPEPFWKFQVRPTFFDLWAISEWQLIQEGILPSHIQIAQIDTYKHTEDYFSFRRSNICGRQATVCALL